MALQARLRASATGCVACRTSLFRHLVAPSSPVLHCATPFRPALSPAIGQLQPSLAALRSRFYSEAKAPPSTEPPAEGLEKELEEGDEQQPWYLNEEPRRHPILAANDLGPLPEAPEGSPPILHKLIPKLAEDLGLEDLNLMDLRSLNPPAALGPGLIMLFGTARSERHLHLSGRTLKSWLQSQGIRVDADGVLTRRALKIKSRRQRKKAKLLGTAAVSYTSDEGIATRWICMNLGTIGSEPQEESVLESSDGGITGFGVRQTDNGMTIVVQMFTESKRKELDLETLWSRILSRKGNPNTIEDDLEYSEQRTHHREVPMFDEGASLKIFTAPAQRRFFSTNHRRFSPLDGSPEVIDPPRHASVTAANNVDTSVDPVKYIDARLAELQQLQAELADLSISEAIEALEDTPDGSPSPLMRAWNNTIKFLPPEQSWVFRMWLVARGRKIGSRRFTVKHLDDLHEELVHNAIVCGREDFLEMLQAVYLEPKDSELRTNDQSEVALRILQTMFERGMAILETDVIVPLIESLAHAIQQHGKRQDVQSALEKLVYQADLPYMGEETLKRLLSAYAHQGNWDRFWEMWRMPPKHLQARSEKLYIFLWDTIATTDNQRLCRQAIRNHFYEMHNESPPVGLSPSIRKAVMACARIAEPTAEPFAERPIEQVRSSTAEFARLWRVLKYEKEVGPKSARPS